MSEVDAPHWNVTARGLNTADTEVVQAETELVVMDASEREAGEDIQSVLQEARPSSRIHRCARPSPHDHEKQEQRAAVTSQMRRVSVRRTRAPPSRRICYGRSTVGSGSYVAARHKRAEREREQSVAFDRRLCWSRNAKFQLAAGRQSVDPAAAIAPAKSRVPISWRKVAKGLSIRARSGSEVLSALHR